MILGLVGKQADPIYSLALPYVSAHIGDALALKSMSVGSYVALIEQVNNLFCKC